MLVWINGPFGGGKTQTAFELRRRLPGSLISDPEQVGFGLHRMLPRELREDFQDWPAWRQGVFETLNHLLTRHDGVVIAPMTVVEPKYFAETVGRLRECGHDVRHFALVADRETVLRRLRRRSLFGLGQEDFAIARVDTYLERLADPTFADHIRTDALTIPQVADHIAAACGFTLTPNTDSPLRARQRRITAAVKSIRVG